MSPQGTGTKLAALFVGESNQGRTDDHPVCSAPWNVLRQAKLGPGSG
jgi:hypothetical protein